MRLLGLVIGVCVLGLLPPAQAEVVTAGASGSCDGPYGGGDDARVTVDTADPAGASADLPSGTGTAAGFTQLVLGLAEDPDPKGNACPGPGYDWLEAHGQVDDVRVQACWDGELRTDGFCPTSY